MLQKPEEIKPFPKKANIQLVKYTLKGNHCESNIPDMKDHFKIQRYSPK